MPIRGALPVGFGVGPNRGLGTVVMDWSNNASLQNSQGVAQLVTASDGPPGRGVTKYLRLFADAAVSFGQCDRSLNVGNLPMFPNSGIGVCVRNPSSRTLQFEVRVFDATAARSIVYNCAAPPTGKTAQDWIDLTAVVNNAVSNTITTGDSYRYVRITQGSSEWPWANGDSLDISLVYLNPRSRPKFMICTDDGKTGNVVPGGTPGVGGWPASGACYLDICNTYGFKGSAAIITGLVGTSGFLSWQQIATLAAAGWTIMNHATADHVGSGNQGMTYLTEAQATADLLAAKAALDAQGYGHSSGIFMLPQGMWNDAVRRACNAAGMIFVGGVGTPLLSGRGGGVPVGRSTGGGHFNGAGLPTIHCGFPDLPARIQIDGTPVLSDVQTFIDDLISTGASGGCYTHNITAGIATLFDGMCAYLRTKVRTGEIDVVTVGDWVRSRVGSRA